MRIGVDCLALQNGAAGVKTYLRNLLPHLALVPDVELVRFVSSAFPEPADLGDGAQTVRVSGRWWNNWVWMRLQLPRAVPPTVNLVHFPAYTAAYTLPCPRVVCVHDVSYAARPEWYPHAAGIMRQRFYRRSAVTAQAVITLSQFSRTEIQAVYGIPSERIFPIHLASGLAATRPAERWDRRGLTGAYLLHVGDLHRRRNLRTAIDAFNAVARERSLSFVLIGKDLGERENLQRHAASLGCAGRLLFLQDVPSGELHHWYSNASLLVYVSLYEGFGLPLLEAMQCGCPVIAGRAASIPEVAGDAAWMVDPVKSDEIAAAIRTVMDQPEIRQGLVQRGRSRAGQFDWRKTAEATADVYRSVLRGRE